MAKSSDAVFPGFLEFPGIGKFPGIRPNFPGIPGNLKKAVFSPYFGVFYSKFASKTSILSLFSAILAPKGIFTLITFILI